MEHSQIESLPLFFRLGKFEPNQKSIYSENYIVSKSYATDLYLKMKYHKPLILQMP
jgi:hypothetical protein